MTTPLQRASLIVVVTLSLLGYLGESRADECASPARRMARVELLFGTTLDHGQALTEADWAKFVDEEVTPRFPDGLTELAGHGQWRRPDGVISHEPSRVLLIWYAPAPDSNAAIEAIRTAYKTRYKQLSVMRVDGADCVSF